MRRKYPIVFVFILLSVIFVSCATAATKKQQEEIPYVANFTYTPDTQAAPGSADVTFAAAEVSYQASAKDTKPWFTYSQFDNLHKAVKEDLTKILVAKGFSVRGPFDAYDLIPYPDKKAIDLWLVPNIELSFKTPEEIYSIEDIKIEVTGTMRVKMQEINTRELMWAKSIPFKFEFLCVDQNGLNYATITWGGGVMVKDVDNKKISKKIASIEFGSDGMIEIAKGIEKEYPAIMATMAKLIDAEEMGIIKKQCREIKNKKGY